MSDPDAGVPPARLLSVVRAESGLDLVELAPTGAGESRTTFWVKDRAGTVSLLKFLPGPAREPAAHPPGPAREPVAYLHALDAITGRLHALGYPAPRLLVIGQAAGQPYPTDAELSARLAAAKATPERAWLGEVSAVILQQSLADLNRAYRNFFTSLTEGRKGPKAAAPRFRSRKDTRQAIRFTANARFKILPNGRLRLPKIGDVPVRWSRPCRPRRPA